MRRVKLPLQVASVVLFGTGLAFLPAAAAHAEEADPTPSASAPAEQELVIGPATAGKTVCTIVDQNLNELSGLVATSSGYVTINDGTSGFRNTLNVFFLDKKCKVTSTFTNSAPPRDPEDLAVDSDGNVWVGDLGDNEKDRPTVAVWKVPKGGNGQATIYRLKYPDGKHNAEALLLDADDKPIVITKDGATARLYQPTKALVPDSADGVPMKKVGEFKVPKTDTDNPLQAFGNTVTGAAKSPDGKKVVLRTYADAYEFTVGEDGDIVAAITKTDPVVTPLPDEPQGEAISYSTDGKYFLTVSERGEAANTKILRYTPYVPPPPADPTDPAKEPAGGTSPLSWFDKLSIGQLTQIVAAVGVVGLVLAVAGIIGIRRARRRRREEEEFDEYDDYDDDYDDDPRGRGRAARNGRGRGEALAAPRAADGYDEFDAYRTQPAAAGATYGAASTYGAGYEGGNGYEGYANAGQQAAGTYGADQYAQSYGADQYGAQQNYGAQQGYGAYDQQQYGAQAPGYGADQYAQSYGADQYGAQQNYGAYDQQQYGGQAPGYGADPQQYGQQYGQAYDEYDPSYDPRRR